MQCHGFFIVIIVNKKYKNMTEQEIKIKAICAILTGRTSNPDYADISISTIVSEAIRGADILLNELWEQEQLTPQTPSHR